MQTETAGADPAWPGLSAFLHPSYADFGPYPWAGTDLSVERIRALSLGLIQSHHWGAYNDTLALVGTDDDPKNAVIEALHEWWGITSSEQILSTVERLHRGMHAPSYAVVHPLVMAVIDSGDRHNAPGTLPSRHIDFLRAYARFQGLGDDYYSRDYELWLQAQRLGFTKHAPTPLPSTIVGWDLCRAAWIVRAGYTAGFISEEQAWPALEYGLKLARQYFANWRQLGDSYLAGHAYWSAGDLSDMEDATLGRRKQLARHWQAGSSPWRLYELHVR